MSLVSCLRPFCGLASLAAVAAVSLPPATSISSARAQSAQVPAQVAARAATAAVAQPAGGAAPDKTHSPAPPNATTGAAPAASAPATDQASSPQQKSLTTGAVDKMKEVVKSASDIFSRVPCLPPKGGPQSVGSLPRVASKLASGQPVLIIAFGSSSTQGYGASAPEFRYPSRLAAQLRRQYPSADITVVNAGVGGEDAPEMMKRLQNSVIDKHPDLVIWQVGTNAVLRDLDPNETAIEVEEGVARIQGAGADVVLVDPQYSPKVTARPESASRIVKLLGRVAQLRHVGIFPRFEVMRDWHEKQAIPIDSFVINDGLHMNDWGYACFAQLLGDDIIKSVGKIKLGVNVPSTVQTYRPM
jgi:lysophospholipase L1-like esterase